MFRESNYWKCEYENLRRKKKKEIANIKKQQLKFLNTTWELLRLLGLKDEDIINYYAMKGKEDEIYR